MHETSVDSSEQYIAIDDEIEDEVDKTAEI